MEGLAKLQSARWAHLRHHMSAWVRLGQLLHTTRSHSTLHDCWYNDSRHSSPSPAVTFITQPRQVHAAPEHLKTRRAVVETIKQLLVRRNTGPWHIESNRQRREANNTPWLGPREPEFTLLLDPSR